LPIAIPIVAAVIACAAIVLMIVRGGGAADPPPTPTAIASTKPVAPVVKPAPAPIAEPTPIAEEPQPVVAEEPQPVVVEEPAVVVEEPAVVEPAPRPPIKKPPPRVDAHLGWRAYLPTAVSVAERQGLANVRLVEIRFERVGPDGRVDLAKRSNHVLYGFRGEGHSCGQTVKRLIDEVRTEAVDHGCGLPGIHWPRCTLAQIRTQLHALRPDLANTDLPAVYQDDRWIIGAAVLDDDCKD
jgi:hypothetical protein